MDSADRPVILQGFFMHLYIHIYICGTFFIFSLFKPKINKIKTKTSKNKIVNFRRDENKRYLRTQYTYIRSTYTHRLPYMTVVQKCVHVIGVLQSTVDNNRYFKAQRFIIKINRTIYIFHGRYFKYCYNFFTNSNFFFIPTCRK